MRKQPLTRAKLHKATIKHLDALRAITYEFVQTGKRLSSLEHRGTFCKRCRRCQPTELALDQAADGDFPDLCWDCGPDGRW